VIKFGAGKWGGGKLAVGTPKKRGITKMEKKFFTHSQGTEPGTKGTSRRNSHNTSVKRGKGWL